MEYERGKDISKSSVVRVDWSGVKLLIGWDL